MESMEDKLEPKMVTMTELSSRVSKTVASLDEEGMLLITKNDTPVAVLQSLTYKGYKRYLMKMKNLLDAEPGDSGILIHMKTLVHLAEKEVSKIE